MSLADTVSSLVDSYGELVTVYWPRTGYDPATGEPTDIASPPIEVTAAIMNIRERDVGGVAVVPGDRELKIVGSALPVRPVIGGWVEIAGERHDILDVREWRLQGGTVAVGLFVRGIKE